MTSIPDLEVHIRQILVDRLGLPAEAVTLEARLQEDLGVDSLDAVEMAIAIERQFDIGLSDEQVASLKTVGDMVALVRRLADGRRARGPHDQQRDAVTAGTAGAPAPAQASQPTFPGGRPR